MTDFDKLVAALEPTATKGESEWPNVAQLSIAISLKRIADKLDGAPDLMIFGNQLLDIAYQAGQNFRGGR